MPTIIDLFSGAGGLSLGAARAGFEVIAAVENDIHALSTHIKNFPLCRHFDNDVRKLKGSELLTSLDLERGELTGLIGGPPCQGFSAIGKRKIGDRRNSLFGHFIRLVNEIRPAFFVAENVPGILHKQYDDVRNRAFNKLSKKYVLLDPITVKASDYGVPTIRTRVFFIGYDPKKFTEDLKAKYFLPSVDAETISVREALEGLPVKISPQWISEEDGWQSFDRRNGTAYMAKITGQIPPKIGHEESIRRYLNSNMVSGCQGTNHSSNLEERYGKLNYGEKDEISKAVKLNPNGFCPTLRAGTGSDKGSFQAVRPIHYSQPRVITPREAARLQGFPDWFVFHPTKWHSFRQIGNSVSPIVAEYLLKIIKEKL